MYSEKNQKVQFPVRIGWVFNNVYKTLRFGFIIVTNRVFIRNDFLNLNYRFCKTKDILFIFLNGHRAVYWGGHSFFPRQYQDKYQ